MNPNSLAFLSDIGLVFRWLYNEYGLLRSDAEFLFYMIENKPIFVKDDFKRGALDYTFDKRRWLRLYDSSGEGWISIYRERNYTTKKYTSYTLSKKAKRVINRAYRICRKQEPIPGRFIRKMGSAKSFKSKRILDRAISFNENM